MSEENEIILEQNNNAPEPIKILPPTFYEKIGDNITLELPKLINIVISRYKLLKEVEFFSRRKTLFYRIIHKKIPIELTWNNEETINNDIASHFLLAFVMCNKTEDLRWFIQQESLLYYARIRRPKYGTPKYDMYKILSILGMKLTLFDPNQNPNIDVNKIKFRRNNSVNEKIYVLSFLDRINLLPQRAYYIHKGNFYILENDLPKLFFKIFQKQQYNIINKIKVNYEEIKKDKRMKEILVSFEKEKEKYNYRQSIKVTKEINANEKLKTIDDIDKYSEKCFPLCMCLIERHINIYSHLTHLGRLQYTLFLKGAGLPVEEALKFYQKKYEKKCSLEQFNKQYSYYIRHAYGLEGKMANYIPYGCDKILSFNKPIGNECHGCPFKTYESEELRGILSTCKLRDGDIEDILVSKNNRDFKMCCIKYFKGKFINSTGEGIGSHPNKYFYSAMRISKGINKNIQNSDMKNSYLKDNNFSFENNIVENNNIYTDTYTDNKEIFEKNNLFDNDIILNQNDNIGEDENEFNIFENNNEDKNIINTKEDSDIDDENSISNEEEDKYFNHIENNEENNNTNKKKKDETNKNSDSEEDDDLDIDIDNMNFFDDI